MKKETNEKKVYTVSEIQSVLGLSPAGTYNLVNSGVFRSVRVGTQIRISKRSFDRWLSKQI
jgi:excisionase family DNA binding protein